LSKNSEIFVVAYSLHVYFIEKFSGA